MPRKTEAKSNENEAAKHECVMQIVEEATSPLEFDMVVIFDGVKIAKRGYTGTPQAETWVSLEPGYEVYGGDTVGGELVVVYNGVPIH